MPRIPILKLRPAPVLDLPELASECPAIGLENLQLGVDNLRHDVHLSPRFVEQMRLHLNRLIARNGGMEGLLAADAPAPAQKFLHSRTQPEARANADTDIKPLLADWHVAALNSAKSGGNPVIDRL